MTALTDLIKSAERKIADPTTTPQTVEREKAIAHYLTSMQAENEIQRDALTALRAENTKLYADLCEMGDMARERSRKRTENVTISGNWDELLRHKWPEEKPVVPDEVEFKVYLARYKIDDEFIFMDSVAYYKDTGWGTSGVTHWWELPEVTE